MFTTSLILASVAALAAAVVYGTDVFAALVLRPALAALDDAALTQAAGRIHQYADQRLPIAGATGMLSAAASTVTALLAGKPLVAGMTGASLAMLLAWLGLYVRIAAPINRTMTRAANAHKTPPEARLLQGRWDSIIDLRVGLQAVALGLLIAALAVS